jgi:hypothetical protein
VTVIDGYPRASVLETDHVALDYVFRSLYQPDPELVLYYAHHACDHLLRRTVTLGDRLGARCRGAWNPRTVRRGDALERMNGCGES